MAEQDPTPTKEQLEVELDPNIGFTYKWLVALPGRGVEVDGLADPMCPGLLARVRSGRVSFRYLYKYRLEEGGKRLTGSVELGELTPTPRDGYRTLVQAQARVSELRKAKGDEREAIAKKTRDELERPSAVVTRSVTVQQAYEEWFTLWVKGNDLNRRTAAKIEQVFRIDLLPHLGHLPVVEVKKDHVRAAIRCMTDEAYHREHALEPRKSLGLAPASGAKALKLVKQFFRYLQDATDHLRGPGGTQLLSPCTGLTARGLACKEGARERALTPEELPLFWRGLEARSGRPTTELTIIALRFLALVPERIGELVLAEPAELQGDLWRVPAAHQKKLRGRKMRPINVPLAPLPLQLFRRMIALSATEGEPGRVCARSQSALAKTMVTHFGEGGLVQLPGDPDLGDEGKLAPTPHSLRHTFSSRARRAGIDKDIRERCLAHVQGGVAGVYDQDAYLPERREALTKWADYVAKLVSPQPTLRVVTEEEAA